MDGTTDISALERELKLLAELDPADIADDASQLADKLASALDELDEGKQT